MPERRFSARAGLRSSDRRPRAHLDPTSPWLIDTREVGRRPGAMRSYHRTVQAPAGLGYGEVISVPEGAELVLELRVESVMEGVLISGSAAAPIRAQCSRCLDEMDDEVTTSFTELFAYPDSATDSTTEADEVSRVVDDFVDLESVAHDALLLVMPQAPLCSPDCPGLCPGCGGKRADLGPDHEHETIDPRWAGLIERFGQADRAGGSAKASDRTEEN